MRREIAFIGALLLAVDIRLKAAYVPSEENPADEPSRGIVRRWRARRSAISTRVGGAPRQEAKVPRTVVKQKIKDFNGHASKFEENLAMSIWRLKHCGPEQSRRYFRHSLASSRTSSGLATPTSSGPSASFCWA